MLKKTAADPAAKAAEKAEKQKLRDHAKARRVQEKEDKQRRAHADKLEYEKRIRIVQEWIIEDWPYTDIVQQIIGKYGIEERQAKRYVAEARDRWVKEDDKIIEQKRKLKIETLKKLKRSLRENYRGTPAGIRAIVAVEKELIKLEGLKPADKIEISGRIDLTKEPIVFK